MPNIFPFLFPVILYAEIHYKFRYFFSLLKKSEPEILADVPHRLEPSPVLPVLVIVKDANIYPITLEQLTIKIKFQDGIFFQKQLLNSAIKISSKYWWNVYNIEIGNYRGWLECSVIFSIERNGVHKNYVNDNYRTTSHSPFKTFIAPSPLPRFDNLLFGECHAHSIYTEDQVEFGAPIYASSHLAKSMGLSFFCVTDHSYDLDDSVDNYLINDPDAPKWIKLQKEIDECNSRTLGNFVIIRGEELSIRNLSDKNVHLLLFGSKDFYKGTGDSAEKWFKNRSELNLADVLSKIGHDVIAISAHPHERVSVLERFLLNRGIWTDDDLSNKQLTGIQFLNGIRNKAFYKGYRQWVRLLLKGFRLIAIAGNDAHGNFGLFRQIHIPFIKIREDKIHLFGKFKTGLFCKDIKETDIINSIRDGKAIITDGPVANLISNGMVHSNTSIGECISGTKHKFSLQALSSKEFGKIDKVTVFIGTIGDEEKVFFHLRDLNSCEFQKDFEIETREVSYVRAEVWTSASSSEDKLEHFCITNPVWYKP